MREELTGLLFGNTSTPEGRQAGDRGDDYNTEDYDQYSYRDPEQGELVPQPVSVSGSRNNASWPKHLTSALRTKRGTNCPFCSHVRKQFCARSSA